MNENNLKKCLTFIEVNIFRMFPVKKLLSI